MSQTLTIEAFLHSPGPILDVRSPGEFEQGHIPDALSFPLFSNAERAEIGTCYKQVGHDEAVEMGFAIAGPKCVPLIQQAKALAPERHVRIHCWRGGMRSASVGWLLEMAGFQTTLLEGGYKAFRRWVRQVLATPRSIIVLGGMTGTSKTEILHAMAALGRQTLDLEALCNHRGSSFGALNLPPQPSTEQFENRIAMALAQGNPQAPLWIEAESRRIGICRIPDELFLQMEAAPTLEVTRPLAERLDYLTQLYGQANPEGLITATERIRKRLGGQRTQEAIAHIRSGNLHDACAIILDYYDRAYRYDLDRRKKTIPQVDITGLTPAASAKRLHQMACTLWPTATPTADCPAPKTPGFSKEPAA